MPRSKSRLQSFRYAFQGIASLLKTQPNARLHLAAAVMVGIAGAMWSLSSSEWCLLILTVSLVWITEAINTAIEFVTDLASPNFHELAGKAKDVAAAAVLLAALNALVIGVIIFGPRLINK
jgi:diacylglycerol kinase (ATP)